MLHIRRIHILVYANAGRLVRKWFVRPIQETLTYSQNTELSVL
jgi:hypothetical protein